MNCNLYQHLKQKRLIARIRKESAEEDRLSLEIGAHLDKCATCAGLESLVQNLFGCAVIVVAEQELAEAG